MYVDSDTAWLGLYLSQGSCESLHSCSFFSRRLSGKLRYCIGHQHFWSTWADKRKNSWNLLKHPWCVKVHLTPKYLFPSNKSLHLFETHCTFLPPFNPNLDFLQVVKVTKSGHHLSHDRASKGYGSIPGLTSQTSLHACLQRLNMMQISRWHQTRNRPIPLTSSVLWQMMARFRNFYHLKKSQDLV